MKTKRSIGAITVIAVIAAWTCGCGKRAAVSQNTAPEPPANKSGTAEPAPAAHTNRLINEKSPYLLQHAHNPVDWFPWGAEAFAKAKREDKPIFLSVGYSTCYWCHVMEKQSFEDAEVAKILNEHFVAIKVDREERPDVDEQYMLATQLVTGRGGWPNSVWLTPDGKPWMAGTYFPKPQFISVLTQLAEVWKKRRAEVDKQATVLAGAIAEAGNAPALAGVELNSKLVDQAVRQIAGRFDPRAGGFGGAPKFPPHGALELLIRQYRNTGDKTLLTPITKTLDAMWLGGMHDHIGGGFHRYSTDARWLLPHFEKMLYDNAQLTRAYTDGYIVAGHARYREAVEDIFRWVQREMTSPQGAFYSAIDSGEVGKEGETYVWRTDQIEDVLGKADAALFARIYNFEKGGNFTEQATGERPGSNIPHLTQPIEALAPQSGENAAAFATRLAQMREKLLARRITWPQPHKDDKVLTSWSGLMIGSLAHAGRQLKEPRYTAAAARAADFILQTMMRDPAGAGLLRSFRDGEAKLPGYLDDYAYFAQGLVALHRATGEKRWLEQADRLAAKLVEDFQDQQNGGFYFTTAGHEDLIMRSKSLGGGGNMPDANGVAVEVLLDLARLADRPAYLAAAKRTLTSLAGLMQQSPHSTEHLLLATADFLRTPTPQSAETREPPVTVASPDATQRVGPVTIRSYVSRLNVKPGETLHVAVALDIDDGWHLYGQNPGTDFLVPSTVSVESSEPFIAGGISSPEPHQAVDAILKQKLNTYTGRIWFRLAVTASSKAKPGAATLALNVKTQACDDSRCLPPETTALRIPIQIDPDAPSDARHPEIFTTGVQTAAASPENVAQADPDAATAWEQLRSTIAEKLNDPADPRKAVDEILADLLRFAETYRGTEEGTAALYNHGMLALNIGQDEAAERSLRRAASEATAPQLAAEIAMQLKQLAIRPGKAPPEFTAPTLAGGKVSPKDFRGRVLLLDFWATWCGPCIAELPNVQQVYRDHHEAGFDIVSISLDRDKAALTDFLKEHALQWTHVFDADSPRESSLAVQYGVDAIPRMILISRDGKIIGLNLRGPALVKAVATALALPSADGEPGARKD